MAMKLTTGILTVAMMVGGFVATKAAAQNPDAIDNARSVAKSLQQKQANDSNAALEAAGVPAQPVKPAAGAPAPAVKPAVIPGAKPAAVSKPAAAPATKAAATAVAKAAVKPASAGASGQNNKLERVNVVRNADSVQIEISSHEAVTPRVSKLSSPARVVVELPATVMATPQSKIAVGSAGVKGVRIGMDGKTPPTTSVVVDLEQACGYELTPGAGNTVVLTLHSQAVAKSAAPVPVKASAPVAKLQNAVSKPVVATAPAAPKVASAAPKVAAVAPKAVPVANVPAAKVVTVAKAAAPKAADAKAPAAKVATTKIAAPATKPATAQANKATAPVAGKPAPGAKADAAKPAKPEEKKWAMSGKRDPFFSPVVQQTGGSGCSTGKKCLEIGQINLRGVVKSENGFIAVVTNNLNKAYFLRENDPVFNGYVVRITGDSVVFQETVQDKLGKPFTREVVKRIFTPAV